MSRAYSCPCHFFAGALRQPHAHLGQSQAALPTGSMADGSPRYLPGLQVLRPSCCRALSILFLCLGMATQGPAARMGWACSFQRMTRAAGPGGQGPTPLSSWRQAASDTCPHWRLFPSLCRSRGEGPCLWNLPGRLGFVPMCRLVCTVRAWRGKTSFFLLSFSEVSHSVAGEPQDFDE